MEKSPPILGRRDPGWVSLERTPSPTVPLSLLAMLQVPKNMEDFEARNQPCLPKGQCPRGQKQKNGVRQSPLSVWGYDFMIDISEGTLQRGAQWASSKDSPHAGSGFHMCL